MLKLPFEVIALPLSADPTSVLMYLLEVFALRTTDMNELPGSRAANLDATEETTAK